MVNQLPQGWKEEELGKHADIKRGSTITKKQVVSGDYPVVAGGKEAAYYHNEYNRQPPVITVSGSGASAGYVNYWEVPIFASDCSTIEEKDLNIKYIYYFLKSRQQELLDKQVGVAIPHVSPKDIYPLLIPYPTDEDEQEYIVKTLDAVAEMIKLRKETIDLTKKLIPAIFQEMFGDPITNPKGWEINPWGNLCNFVRGPFGGSLKKEIFINNGYLVYEQYHAINNDFTFGRYFIDEDKYKEMKRFSVHTGDILISCSGTMGKIAVVPENHKEGIINQALLKINIINSNINSVFLKSLLEEDVFNERYLINNSGAAIKNIYPIATLKNVPIITPPLSMQEEFADKVDQINKYITAQQVELKHFETLFQSLLQEAFTGVLTWKYPRKENND